ncbi:hypothetical protein JW824_14590 [bacterium]|nr:hypothetical protein [bacterium]
MDRKKIKNLLFKLSLLLAAFIIFYVIAESAVRLLYKDKTVLFPRYHTDAHYGAFTLRRIRPDSEFWHTSPDGSWKFTINKQGFRNNKDFEYDKPEKAMRILCLGDSHTQGYEVRQDYTFSAVIEKYLLRQGYNAEVINAGVSGFSTAEELIFLENEGIKYHPDVVVLGFSGTDFEDNIKTDLFKLEENGDLVVQQYEYIPGVRIQNMIYALPCVRWLSENSYFYSLLFNNVWNYFKTRMAEKASDEVIEYAVPTQDTYSDYQAELTSALIRCMYNFCESHDVKFIVIDIPDLKGENGMRSSFYGSLFQTVTDYSNAYILSDSLLSDYVGVAELHLPRGHLHISEFTHTLIGVSVAQKIISLIQ